MTFRIDVQEAGDWLPGCTFSGECILAEIVEVARQWGRDTQRPVRIVRVWPAAPRERTIVTLTPDAAEVNALAS
jgi:hypothetical protein